MTTPIVARTNSQRRVYRQLAVHLALDLFNLSCAQRQHRVVVLRCSVHQEIADDPSPWQRLINVTRVHHSTGG